MDVAVMTLRFLMWKVGTSTYGACARAHIATISFIDWNDPGSARIAPIHMTSSRSKSTRWIGSWSAGGRSAIRIRSALPSASARSMSSARCATVASASERPPR